MCNFSLMENTPQVTVFLCWFHQESPHTTKHSPWSTQPLPWFAPGRPWFTAWSKPPEVQDYLISLWSQNKLQHLPGGPSHRHTSLRSLLKEITLGPTKTARKTSDILSGLFFSPPPYTEEHPQPFLFLIFREGLAKLPRLGFSF